jgi:glyoxylase-like metal-dependent hydrolase (beta-lactamase superfamily II)
MAYSFSNTSCWLSVFLLTVSCATAPGLAKELTVMELQQGLICLQDPLSTESSNSFLIHNQSHDLLIDAGWSSKTSAPSHLAKTIDGAVKVATHMHFDHSRRWHEMAHVALSPDQRQNCSNSKCKPGTWTSINSVGEFNVESTYRYDEHLDQSEIVPLRCGGHSATDTCFIDLSTKTLFLWDIFYLGTVFYFLPGGSLTTAISSLKEILKRNDWTQIALTHGSCQRIDRQILSQFVDDLSKIKEGKISGRWNFDFWIPLRTYKISTGTIILRPVFQ